MSTITAKKFCTFFASSVTLIIILVASFNVAVDPYDYFGNQLVSKYFANPRFSKLRRIKATPHKFDAFIFGSCLSSVLRPDKLNNATPYTWFNFSTHNSSIIGPTIFIEKLLDMGVEINAVIYNIDNLSLHFDSPLSRLQIKQGIEQRLDTVWPKELGGDPNLFNFMLSYAAIKRSITTLWYNATNKTQHVIEKDDGYWFWTAAQMRSQEENSNGIKKYIGIISQKKLQPFDLQDSAYIPLQEIQAIRRMANENNIKIYFFIPPHYIQTKKYDLNQDQYINMHKKLLLACGQLYDFDTVNPYVFEIENYMDHERFNPQVGDQIIDDILNGEHLYSAKRLEEYVEAKGNFYRMWKMQWNKTKLMAQQHQSQ